jgi:hypothetical protein
VPQDDMVMASDEADRVDEPRSRRPLIVAVVVLVVVAAGIGTVLGSRSGGSGSDAAKKLATRRADVERRGASVMPFDQSKTMHRFSETANGGVETVTANDPNDSTQIQLVQQHLAHERDLFSAGNFTDPMAIHGMNMPGLEDLQTGAAAGRVTITYAAIANGARLTYSTNDPDLIDALHTWFDAQLMDHGAHAMG